MAAPDSCAPEPSFQEIDARLTAVEARVTAIEGPLLTSMTRLRRQVVAAGIDMGRIAASLGIAPATPEEIDAALAAEI